MLRELTAALGEIEYREKGARCLILTGAGRGFCAGAHLADPESNRSSGGLKAESLLQEWYHRFYSAFRDLRMPFLTAVNGPAAGVRDEPGDDGRLCHCGPVGLLPAGLSADRSHPGRRLNLSAASKGGLVQSNGTLNARRTAAGGEKALEWGLVNRVVNDGQALNAAIDLGRELAAGHTVSIALIRKAYWQSFNNTSTAAPPRVRASDRGRSARTSPRE